MRWRRASDNRHHALALATPNPKGSDAIPTGNSIWNYPYYPTVDCQDSSGAHNAGFGVLEIVEHCAEAAFP